MSLTDVGLQFKLTGADDFDSKLRSIKGSYDSLSSATGKGMDISPHLQKMTGSLNTAHNKITGFFRMTEGAILAFLAGSAVKGLANWITGGQGGRDIDKMKDFIRYKGADKAYMDAVGDKIKQLSQSRPFDMQDAWNAQEQVISLTGPKRPDLAARATEAAANLGYTLAGPKGSSNSAMDFARGAIESYGAKLDPEGKTALLERLGPLLKYVTDTTQTKGYEIEGIFRQIISMYAGSGKSIEEAFADAGILGGAMGLPGGEVLKNIIAKQGSSYGKYMAEVDYQNKLAGIMSQNPRIKSEADLPDDYYQKLQKAKSKAEKAYSAEGGRIAAAGDLQQVMSNILQGKQILERAFKVTGKDPVGILADAFGETGIKGVDKYNEAIASGLRDSIIRHLRQLRQGSLTPEINAAQQSLGGKAETLDQAISGLSKEFRRIFEPAAIGIIDEAKKTFIGFREKLGLMNKEGEISKNMKDGIAGVIGGYKAAVSGQEETPKTLDEIIAEFAQGLAGGGWAESGQKLGTAIGEFATAASQFAHMIGLLYKPIAYFQSLFGQGKEKPSDAEKMVGSSVWALALKKIAGIPGALYGLATGGEAMNSPFGMMATGAVAGWRYGGQAGIFPGAVAGATYPVLRAGTKPENADMWPIIRGSAADILNSRIQSAAAMPPAAAPPPKPEVTNEVTANINEEKLTEWLTITIKTILKTLGGQKDESWKNSQDWGAGVGGP